MTFLLAQLAGLFTAPALAVAGAACVAIPIIIHLLSRSRRRRADWGAMRFLRLAYKKQRRKLRLEKWLLLLTRCAIMLVAGLALAGPLLSGALGDITSGGGGGRTVHVVLDDGLSSRALAGEGVRFDRLRGLATGLLDGLDREDRVKLWTVSPGGAGLDDEPTVDHNAVGDTIRQMSPGYGRSDLAATLTRVAAAVDAEAASGGGASPVVAIFSDFARGAAYLDQPPLAELEKLGDRASVVATRPAIGTGNVQVGGLQPRRALVLATERGNAVASVEASVRRFDDDAAAAVVPIRLTLTRPDGTTASEVVRDARWSAGQATTTLSADLPLTASPENPTGIPDASPGGGGMWTVTAALDAAAGVADGLLEDNERRAVIEVRPGLRVGVVDEASGTPGSLSADGAFSPGAFVRAALSPRQTGTAFSVATQDLVPATVNEDRLRSLDAVLVLRPEMLGASAWDALGGFAQRGGLVWLFPPAATDSSGVSGGDWFDLMASTMGVAWELQEDTADTETISAPRRLDSDPRPPEALLLLSADWSALLGPVRATRWLDVTTPAAEESWIRWSGEANDGAFLAGAAVGEGRLLLVATAIDPAWTNLPTKPVFPALLHDALRGVLGQVAAAAGEGATVGERPELGRRWADAVALVSGGAGETQVLLETSEDREDVTTLEPLREPGVFAPRSGNTGRRLAVNVPADAGDVRAADPALVKTWLDGLGAWNTIDAGQPAAVLATAQKKSNFGWVLLWVLLGLVLLETALARWFSYASAGQRGGAGEAVGGAGIVKKKTGKARTSRAAAWVGAAVVLGAKPQTAAAQSPLDRWLGLNEVSWTEATAVGFRYALPAWAWVLIAAAAVGVAWWSYRRLLGPTWVRAGLAALRGLLILLIAVLLAGPEVVRTDETVEQDVLLVLVDRSASMNVSDVPAPPPEDTNGSTTATLVSRDAALRAALKTQGEVFGPEQLGRDRQVTWLGFGDTTFDLSAPLDEPGVDALPEPTADATALRGALEEALRRGAGRPISGIVVMSDGRSPEATGASLLDRLALQSVRVFTVPLGAERLPLDLMIARVDPPRAAFINDPVPVTVVVEQPGVTADEQVDPARVTVRLIDTDTQDVVDQKTLEDVGLGQPLRLEGRSSQVGELPWAVEVVYDGGADDASGGTPGGNSGGGAELNLTNNVESFTVEMIDRPIRVLYVEGYPRWDYRYLKNMLIREQSIDSSILLLSADRAFAQEGDTPITRLPSGPEEWRRYDVVILGDVSPEAFSVEQRKDLFDLVAQRGAGLLWVGGSRATPTAYGATMLSDLLPMREPEAAAVLPSASLSATPTALAETLSVLQLRSVGGEETSAEIPGAGAAWPEDLPTLRWVQDLGNLKPSAEVLATASSAGDRSGRGDPLVTRLRFGAGQTLYVGTDETWRWRYARGEVYFEQFWVQLVRLLGRSAATRSDEAVRMNVSARQTPRGGTVVVDVDIDDAALLARNLPSLRVAVREAGDDGGVSLAEFELRPGGADDGGATSGGGRYSSPWLAGVAGELELVVVEPALVGFDLRVPIEVVAPDDERRRAEADVPRLVKLAEDTGGRVVPLDDLAQLTEPGVVRNLARKTANDVAEPIWNSALALALVVGLITLEWIMRKLIRLV